MPNGRNVQEGAPESEGPVGTLRSISFAVPDVEGALEFYQRALGLTLQFRDGSRWAALSTNELTVALTTPEEHPDAGMISFNVRVTDVAAALPRLIALGAVEVMAATRGAHEVRAAVRTPHGHVLTVYQPV